MNLYEINAEIEKAMDDMLASVNEETGEVDDSYVKALDSLMMEKREKLENIGMFIKNLNAEAEMLKNEENALKERRKAKEKKIEKLKKYVASALNGEKFETTKVVFSFRKSDEVNIVDASLIPAEYMRIPEAKPEPDKNAIKYM